MIYNSILLNQTFQMLENSQGVYHDPFNSSQMKFEQLRLARLRQQRSRMENMKETVEKYSIIIRELERKNLQMSREIQHLKMKQSSFSQLLEQKQQLICVNSELRLELENEKIGKRNLQNTIRQLKEDISILSSGMGKTFSYNQIDQQQILIEYQTLQELYDEVKKQIYKLNKENLDLKQVISLQSKSYVEKQPFWKQFSKLKVDKEASSKKLRTIGSDDQKHYAESFRHTVNSNDKEKIKQLENQNQKLEMLVQKFKSTDEKQRQLIDLLKNHGSKVCICHSHGVVRSSQKIIFNKEKNQENGKNPF